LWKRADQTIIRSAVQDFTNRFIQDHTATTAIDNMWIDFTSAISKIIETTVPSKMSSTRHNKLWITAKIKRLSRRKKRAFKKAQCSGTADDLKRYKDLQKEQHYECRKANQAYVRDTVKDNPKKLYSFIKWKRSDSTGISHLKCDGVTHNDPSKKATILNKQFTGMFTTEDTADVSHGWRQLPRHASLRSISRRRQ